MTNILKAAVTAGVLALGLSEASAAQLTGTINFGSTSPIQLNSGDFTTVSAVDFQNTPGVPNAVVIPGSTGDFALLVGQPAEFLDFSTGAAVNDLWSLSLFPGFNFDLTTSQNFSANNTFLNISGTGWVNAPTFDATPGVFTLTASRSGGSTQVDFSFAASTTATPERTVPDGGSTAVLLGAALLGVGTLSRRK